MIVDPMLVGEEKTEALSEAMNSFWDEFTYF
jgi:hypothetical protein